MSDNVVKPWTLKSIPLEDRNAAITAARRQQMTISAWIRRAIHTQMQADHQAENPPPPPDFQLLREELRSTRDKMEEGLCAVREEIRLPNSLLLRFIERQLRGSEEAIPR